MTDRTAISSPISSTCAPGPLPPELPRPSVLPNPLKVAFGQATFDAEGREDAGPYFSRTIHWPGGASGVTIGRGYDLGGRSASRITLDLLSAGVPHGDAAWLARAAGLRGEGARIFFERERGASPTLGLVEQQRLFEKVVAPEIIEDITRIFSKQDVVAQYGLAEWHALPLPAQEIIFDLRYRGDYTPRTREFLQPLIVSGQWEGLAAVMQDRGVWRSFGVPEGRITARAAMAQRLLADAE